MSKGPYIMAVTNDEYELPIAPPMRQEELAKLLGIHASTICHFFSSKKSHRRSKRKYIKLDFDLDDTETC